MTDNNETIITAEENIKRGVGRPRVLPELKLFPTHQNVNVPKFQTQQAACFDLSASIAGKTTYSGYQRNNAKFERPFHNGNAEGEIYLAPGDRVMVPTGLIADIPEGFSVRVHARSGSAVKKGLTLINGEGIVDSDYIEEIYVLLWNTSDNGIYIKDGDRIAQAELVRDEKYVIQIIGTAPEKKTDRDGGFGSTGV